jgi:phenylpyruvate tautomerase PptA (4-oxalocrotonate tautomerase family)
MPLVDVAIVLRPQESLRATLARELADRIGEVLGSSPGSTWVTVRAIGTDQYAENLTESTAEVRPVFVTIRKSQLPPRDMLQREVSALTPAIARVCGRPEQHVHIIYQPDGAGRVAFGGALVTD